MNEGKYVFTQVTSLIPRQIFQRLVKSTMDITEYESSTAPISQHISPQVGYRVILQTHKAESYSEASAGLFRECSENPLMDSNLFIPAAGQNQGNV